MIKEIAYELYKQDWVDAHTTRDMRLDNIREWGETEIESDNDNYYFEYKGVLEEFGYNGELYSSYEEFIDNEYNENEYMKQLLNNDKLYKAYLKDNFYKLRLYDDCDLSADDMAVLLGVNDIDSVSEDEIKYLSGCNDFEVILKALHNIYNNDYIKELCKMEIEIMLYEECDDETWKLIIENNRVPESVKWFAGLIDTNDLIDYYTE